MVFLLAERLISEIVIIIQEPGCMVEQGEELGEGV